jgi:hypothetical protein
MLTKFGLGTKRTLDQFIAFTGVDLRSRQIFGDRCKQLTWVPFEADEDPNTTEGDHWGLAPEIHPAGGGDIPLASGEIRVSMQGVRRGNTSEAEKGVELLKPKVHTYIVKEHETGKKSESDKLHRIEALIAEDLERLEQKASGELWWVFQHVDMAVEAVIEGIDGALGSERRGHGHKVLKVMLLGAPLFIIIVLLALWVVTGTSVIGSSFHSDTNSKII